jgi:hypothetical protein
VGGPEYPEKTHDFWQSVDFNLVQPGNEGCVGFYSISFFLLFSHEDWVLVALRKFSLRFEPATLRGA